MIRKISLGLALMLAVAACSGSSVDEMETTTTISSDVASTDDSATTADETESTTTTTSDVDSTDDTDATVEEHEEYLPEATGEPTLELDVELSEMAFDPQVLSVEAGQTVRFNLVNAGAVAHEFRLSNEHRIEEHLAAGHEEEEDDHGEEQDVVVVLDAGESRTIDVTFPEDPDEVTQVACLIRGHYESGMFGEVIIGG